jgi:hypothetical protein
MTYIQHDTFITHTIVFLFSFPALLMIIAWILFTGLATIIARYFKSSFGQFLHTRGYIDKHMLRIQTDKTCIKSMEMKMKKKWNFKSKKRCSKCFISSTVSKHKTNQVLRNNFTSYIEVILSHNLNKVIEKWIHNLQFVCTNFCGTYMCTHCSFVEYIQVLSNVNEPCSKIS